MLYLETTEGFVPWIGQAIDGILHSRDIEGRWSALDLASQGLYAPAEAGDIPAGKVSTGTHVDRVDDVVRYVHDLADFVPSSTDIDAERERRIALPLQVSLSVGTIEINMDPLAQRNLQGLASVGQYLVATNPTQITAFRAYDNESYDLLPADLIAMGLQVAGRIQACYAAEWALKAIEPIPATYTDDSNWP